MRSTCALPPAVQRRLAEWAEGAYPREACGLLAGTRRADGSGCDVRFATLARNHSPRADRYDLDPGDHVRAEDRARGEGLEVVGAWHSHPDRPAEPSESDRRGAWERWSYVIVPVGARGAAGPRAWRLSGGRFAEERIEAAGGPRRGVRSEAGDGP